MKGQQLVQRLEPALHPQRIHLPPGSLFTGTRAYACDGGVIRAVVEGTKEQPRMAEVTILELHDMALGRRRSRQSIGATLRRCLRRLQSEGMIVVLGDQVATVPAERISVEEIRFQQFCTPIRSGGPFRGGESFF